MRAFGLCFTFIAALNAFAAADSLKPAEHGDFDHYTFALTWQPGICSTQAGCLPDQPATPLIGLHGLWASLPDGLARQGIVDKEWWAKGCSYYEQSDAAPALDPKLEQKVEAVMPHFAHSLLTHEYDKHVECFGFDPNQFFSTELAMRDAVIASPFGTYLMQQAGRDVTHDDVVNHFVAAFSTNYRTAIQLQCEQNAKGQVVFTQFWFQIRSSALDAFPKPSSFMDTPSNEDTCPAQFHIPSWPT